MRSLLSERNIVVILFVLVLITFSLAQEDSKKMEQMYTGTGASAVSRLANLQQLPAKSESPAKISAQQSAAE